MKYPLVDTTYRLTIFLGFVVVFTLYYIWTWSGELAGIGGDNAMYLLTAKYFSPYFSASEVVQYFANRSPYPPLYPLILAMFGGGESILIAHFVTTTCLLLAFLVLFFWMHIEGFSHGQAFILSLVVAVLPGTYMQALSVHSENLYLFLSLLGLSLVSASQIYDKPKWLWGAAIAICAATLTRSVGISLVAAFIFYLWFNRIKDGWKFVLVVFIPILFWQVFNSQEGSSYYSVAIEKYSGDTLNKIVDQVIYQAKSLRYGWLSNLLRSRTGLHAASILGVIALSGMLYRLYRFKLDGLYACFYLALLLVWPYPAEVTRFVFVLVPVLFIQSLLLLRLLPIKIFSKSCSILPNLMLAGVLLLAIPEAALISGRFQHPLPTDLKAYKRNPIWYSSKDPQEAILQLADFHSLINSLRKVPSIVPEDSCVYSIKASILGLYADRQSTEPPKSDVDDISFIADIREHDCKYFFMMAFASPSYNRPFYPLDRLKESLEILHTERNAKKLSQPVVSMIGQIRL